MYVILSVESVESVEAVSKAAVLLRFSGYTFDGELLSFVESVTWESFSISVFSASLAFNSTVAYNILNCIEYIKNDIF